MMHDVTRIWRTAPLPDSSNEAAAEIRRCGSWTSCTAWSWRGLLLLNDQMSPDGAFKLAIIRLTGPERRTSIEEQRKSHPYRAAAIADIRSWTGGEPEIVISAYEQLESLTVSWMDEERLRDNLERCAAGDAEIWSRGTVLLDRTDGHRCEHCA